MRKNRESAGKGERKWVVTVFVLAVVLSAALSLLSGQLLNGSGLVVAVIVLLLFVAVGIFFDIVGVAVTAADPRPFHSMASHKAKGAKESLSLLKNASHVSSVCNDVVGDICGIVSGTTAAVIVTQLQRQFSVRAVVLSVGTTALISGLTIGGKALGKTYAIRRSTDVVYFVGRVLHIFHR